MKLVAPQSGPQLFSTSNSLVVTILMYVTRWGKGLYPYYSLIRHHNVRMAKETDEGWGMPTRVSLEAV